MRKITCLHDDSTDCSDCREAADRQKCKHERSPGFYSDWRGDFVRKEDSKECPFCPASDRLPKPPLAPGHWECCNYQHHLPLCDRCGKANPALVSDRQKKLEAVVEAAREFKFYKHYGHYCGDKCSKLCSDVDKLKEAFANLDGNPSMNPELLK